MGKYIVLAFDDGGKDQFTNGVQILKKYDLTGSFYITTGIVDGTLEPEGVIKSSGGFAMSQEDIRTCISLGMEIGSHSDKHTNEIKDIETSLYKLTSWCNGCVKEGHIWGFASPSSDIYAENLNEISGIKGRIKYVRTGVQIRRNGIFYAGFFLLNRVVKSKRIFWILNKKYINRPARDIFLVESIAIKSDTPVDHIKYFASKIKEGECAVFLFHSILDENEQANQMNDCWYYKKCDFEKICRYFSDSRYKVITVADAINHLSEKEER